MLRKMVEICRAGGLGTGAAFLLCLGGCATIKPESRIREAGALVGERLGQKPDWLRDWDATAPVWEEGDELSVDDAVARALRNNRALRADLELIGQMEADRVQAGLWTNPSVGLAVMFPAGGGLAMLQGNGVPMVALQDLWLIPQRKRAAAARLQEAVLRVADRAVEVATEVRRVYAELQFTQRAVELMRDNILLADQSVQIIQARQSAGEATQVATNLARIRARRLQSDLIALEADYRSRQRDLLLLMGASRAADIWRVTAIHEHDFAVAEISDEQALLQTGIEQRLDLLAAGWSLQAAARQIVVARREVWPDVQVGVGFQREARARATGRPTLPARVGNASAQALADRAFGVAPMPFAPEVQPWQKQAREPEWTIGPMFEIELPIFDQNQAQIARAVHEYRQRRAEFEDRAQTITRDIRSGLVRHRQAREQIEFYRSSVVPEVQRNLELAQQSFVAGQEGLTVYLLAQEDVILTRLRVLEFMRDYLLIRADLERAVGGRLPEVAAAPTAAPSENTDEH